MGLSNTIRILCSLKLMDDWHQDMSLVRILRLPSQRPMVQETRLTGVLALQPKANGAENKADQGAEEQKVSLQDCQQSQCSDWPRLQGTANGFSHTGLYRFEEIQSVTGVTYKSICYKRLPRTCHVPGTGLDPADAGHRRSPWCWSFSPSLELSAVLELSMVLTLSVVLKLSRVLALSVVLALSMVLAFCTALLAPLCGAYQSLGCSCFYGRNRRSYGKTGKWKWQYETARVHFDLENGPRKNDGLVFSLPERTGNVANQVHQVLIQNI
ncbi:hypothetical protein TREES_T100001946 [Tupaia chinensis]|uniref:Uncharacterized protein n=1 Tax=Tupaia chinensis TaxID=246437 RepID=L9JD65_TUPCH|nr:hypothetical protein TREES_T100001946 [Tupaia chinensis]